MTTRVWASVLVLAAACNGRKPERADTSRPASLTCGYDSTTRIMQTGVAALQIGLPDSAVFKSCAVLRDSIESAEGHPQRVLVVRVGPSAIRAEIVNGSVWRLSIQDSFLRTADGLGVGTTLGELLQDRNLGFGNGETGVFFWLPRHCGLSFRIDPRAPGIPRPWAPRSRESIARVPLTTPVDLVLVVGRRSHCASQ